MPAEPRQALESLLDFYAEAGVDCAVGEAARDRFRLEEPPSEARSTAPVAGQRAAPPERSLPRAAAAAPDLVADDARQAAREAATLEKLQALLARFEGCSLKVSAKNLAFADGNPAGRVMLVGEAPGADEDRIGKPFMGRAGQLLDRMLTAIGLDRTQVYIANIVPWRPPGNRTPTPQEVAVCRPFIERQIELAEPEFLVCLGGAATQALLGTKDGILRSRGRWFPYAAGEREVRALATLHPAYLLRQPAQKRLAWRDFLALRRALDGRA